MAQTYDILLKMIETAATADYQQFDAQIYFKF